MAITPSNMLPLGTTAPDFKLQDSVSDKILSLNTLKSDTATVIFFICNHCPYVKHIQKAFVVLANDYLSKNIAFIAINANDAEKYPEDAPDKMRTVAQELAYPFPYLYDETQAVAKAYQAACTPDFYIFDRDLKCVYRGQFDGSRPGNAVPVTGKDIRDALNHILANQPVNAQQKSSLGCNIKWKG